MNHQQHSSQTTPESFFERHIETTGCAAPAPQPRLLVVEDHAQTAQLMRYALRRQGRVDVVATAEAAIRRADAVAYDGVLRDITLRGARNGLDVLDALRARPAYRCVPMIAVTAHALPGDRERFLEAGVDGYVAKPFTPDQLRTAVREQLAAFASRPSAHTKVAATS